MKEAHTMASNGFLVFLQNLATQAASNPALGTALSGIGAQLNNTGTAVKNARLYLARYQQALTAYRAATDPAIKTMLLTSVETAATALATRDPATSVQARRVAEGERWRII
jgi:hypothetical protein